MWLEEALHVFTHLTTLSLCCKIILLIVKQIHQVKKTVRLGGRFHTPVLDNTMKIPYLRTTPETETKGSKKVPYLRTENLKNHTLFCGTYLYSPYMGVPLPPGFTDSWTENHSAFSSKVTWMCSKVN